PLSFMDATCGTTKKLRAKGEIIGLAIPAGTEQGDVLRVPGKGESKGGKTGDCLVEIKEIKPHEVVTRNGNDIHLNPPVSSHEAVLGANVAVPTVRGAAEVDIPRGADSGQTVTIKGAGVKGGNQVMTLDIVVPDEVDAEL